MNDSEALALNVGISSLFEVPAQYVLSPKQVMIGASVSGIKIKNLYSFLFDSV